MASPSALVRLSLTALLGAASTWLVLLSAAPMGLVLVVAGAGFMLLLLRNPRVVAAFALGAVATLGVLTVVWSSGWGCASEVDGVVVEHDCGEPPYRG